VTKKGKQKAKHNIGESKTKATNKVAKKEAAKLENKIRENGCPTATRKQKMLRQQISQRGKNKNKWTYTTKTNKQTCLHMA
jgi:hypothetical protein